MFSSYTKTALCGLAYPLLKITIMTPLEQTKHITSRGQIICKSYASDFQHSQALTFDVTV